MGSRSNAIAVPRSRWHGYPWIQYSTGRKDVLRWPIGGRFPRLRNPPPPRQRRLNARRRAPLLLPLGEQLLKIPDLLLCALPLPGLLLQAPPPRQLVEERSGLVRSEETVKLRFEPCPR